MEDHKRRYFRLDPASGFHPFLIETLTDGKPVNRILVTDLCLDGIGFHCRGYGVVPGCVHKISSMASTSPLARMLHGKKLMVVWSDNGEAGGILDTPLAACENDFFKKMAMSTGNAMTYDQIRALAKQQQNH